MTRHAFLVTSAINTKFGVYKSDQRLEQTMSTIQSIRERVDNPMIIIMELAGEPLTPFQKKTLTENCDHLLDFTDDPAVQSIYADDNWDVVKNVTEVMCFGRALKMLHQDINLFKDIDRIFKMSGRYLLTDNFKIDFYDQYSTRPFIVIGPTCTSQFPKWLTECDGQYMARLWSWPTALNLEIIKVFENSLEFMYQRLSKGGYADIEHVLYKFLDPGKLLQIPKVGVKGNIAPNGQYIEN